MGGHRICFLPPPELQTSLHGAGPSSISLVRVCRLPTAGIPQRPPAAFLQPQGLPALGPTALDVHQQVQRWANMPHAWLLCHGAAKPDCSTQIWGALGGVAPLPEDAEEGVRPPQSPPFWAGDTHLRRVSGEMCEELLSRTALIPAVLGHRVLAGRGQRRPWLDKYGWAGSCGANGRYSSSPQLNDELVNSCVSLVCTKGIEPLFVCFLS